MYICLFWGSRISVTPTINELTSAQMLVSKYSSLLKGTRALKKLLILVLGLGMYKEAGGSFARK